MPMINTFGVIGGDERMKYLAQSIAADGYPVCVCGLEKLGTCRGAAECDCRSSRRKAPSSFCRCPQQRTVCF